MSENLKLFLQKAAQDEALAARLGTFTDKDEAVAAAIAEAAQLGIELTEADFAVTAEDLSEEELAAVAGGAEDKQCSCILGGGGGEDSWDDVCACVLFGYSDSTLCILMGAE